MISFKPNELIDYLHVNLPQFIRNNVGVDEYQLIKLRKNTKLEIAKHKKLIPTNFNQTDYNEFIGVLNKFRRKIHNAKFHQNSNYRKTNKYRENANKIASRRYNENRESHNEYCRLYGNTDRSLKIHYEKFKHSLNYIKLLERQYTRVIIMSGTSNEVETSGKANDDYVPNDKRYLININWIRNTNLNCRKRKMVVLSIITYRRS